MSLSPAEIESVVRQVLEKIAQLDDSAAAAVQAPSAPAAPAPAAQPAPACEVSAPTPAPKPAPAKTNDAFTVRDRVVTLASLEGRPKSIRRVVVSQGAIVTPAVRDMLREEGLALETGATNGHAAKSSVRLAAITMGTPFDPTPLLTMLRSDGLDIENTNKDCLIESVGELAQAVGSADTLGLLLTKYVPAALCLANRREGVRAVTATTAEETEKAARSVGANLLVIDPRKAGGITQMKMAVRAFCSGGIRACPDVFAALLS